MRYYYTYIINCGTITRAGAGTRNKIFKHIGPEDLANIKIVAFYDNFNDARKHAVRVGVDLLQTPAGVCNETGVYSPSARQAAEWAGTGEGNMNKHLKGIGSWKTLRGMTFRYVNKVQRNNS